MFSKLSDFSKKIAAAYKELTVKELIMGIGSVLLLVVFLAPSAVSQCSRLHASAGTVYATTKSGASLTLGDLDQMRDQIKALVSLRMVAASAVQQTGSTNVLSGFPILMWLYTTDLKDPGHWWLLVHEAQDAGLVGGAADGEAFLARLAPRFGASIEDLLARIASDTKLQRREILGTFANLAGVERLMELTAAAPRAGATRQKGTARDLLTTVSCDVVPIRAQSVGNAISVADPTPEELNAQFSSAREFAEGKGPAGAGYKLPDRVRVEWFSIPANDIAHGIADDPALSPIELRKEYMRNREQYSPAAAISATPMAPNFDEAKERVEAAVRKRLLDERIDKVAAYIRDWNRASVKELPTNGALLELPKDWAAKMPPLTALAEDLTNRFKLHHPPRVDGSGPTPIPIGNLEKDTFIGALTTSEFGQPMTGAAIVGQVHELAAQSRLPVQVGVLGPVLYTPARDIAVFRVVEAVPTAAPTSLAEVQAAVVRDALSNLRYAELVRKAPEILAKAEKSGLPLIASEFNTVVDKVPQLSLASPRTLMMGFTGTTGSLSAAGSDTEAIKAVVDRALALPSGAPISTLPESERMLTVPVPSKQLLLVVKINDVTPVTLEDWEMLSGTGALTHAMASGEGRVNLPEVFSEKAVRERHGYTLKNPDGPDRPMPSQAPIF